MIHVTQEADTKIIKGKKEKKNNEYIQFAANILVFVPVTGRQRMLPLPRHPTAPLV
jgi:hypothetical protein